MSTKRTDIRRAATGRPDIPTGSCGGSWDPSALVEARGICKYYPGFSLSDVSLAVHAGEVVGFVGRNGAGKSTTIKALLGLTRIDGGQARVMGVSPEELASSAAEVKERIGVVFDTAPLPATLRVRECGSIMATCFASHDAREFDRLLQAFGLPADKRVKDLSRGMGMKLSLACALSHHPQLLLLDEATAGLDPMARDEVLDVLREFVSDEHRAILMSSHITSDLEKVADTIVCIDEGRIAFARPKDEICDQMGMARCRTADLERIRAICADDEGRLTVLRQEMGCLVLVDDYFAFTQALPDVICEHMTIDDYMAFSLKGERI